MNVNAIEVVFVFIVLGFVLGVLGLCVWLIGRSR
jgi:hypothetical protein